MGENILRTINDKMKGIWYDQSNNSWQFLPDGDNSGMLIHKDEKRKYKFFDEKAPKLEVEFQIIYNYSNLFSGTEIHFERNKTDFVYLSRKRLDLDLIF